MERSDRKNLKPELPDFKFIWYLLTLGLKLKQKLRLVFIEGKVIIDLLLQTSVVLIPQSGFCHVEGLDKKTVKTCSRASM